MNYSDLKEDKRLIEAVPTARQSAYESMEFFCFIHFTVNTFTGREWGDGTEPESIFNPTELDAKQWAKTAAEGGMKGLILTCKHHDGFCLWPSKYTEHSIKNSPYKNGKGDIVAMTANAFTEDKSKALKAGMDEYLTKPLESENIQKKQERYTIKSASENLVAPAADDINIDLQNETKIVVEFEESKRLPDGSFLIPFYLQIGYVRCTETNV